MEDSRRCLGGSWNVSGICLEVVMNVYRRFMEGICMVSGRCSRRCLEVVLLCGIWKVLGRCFVSVLYFYQIFVDSKVLRAQILGPKIFLNLNIMVPEFF